MEAENERLSEYENFLDINGTRDGLTESQIRSIIQQSCVGFPDYANRTELTSGTQYTADANMYIIIDMTGQGDKNSPTVQLTINGESYKFDSQYNGVDYSHHSESIIPIKKGDVFTLTFIKCKAYKVLMRY